jgi:large subunit ribosomal protein L10
MSKQIKQMQMQALRGEFGQVRDFVVLSISGLTCQADNQLRLGLRKKNIRLQMVKNSLSRKVFAELGLQSQAAWAGPTVLAWGAGSIAELSRTLDADIADLVKKNPKLKDKIQFKGAFAEGQEITFERAKTMPTRAEAIGRVIALALAPAARIAAQLKAPGGILAGQVKSLAEKKPDEEPAPAASS